MPNDNYMRKAKVIKVTDGDTCKVCIDLGFKTHRKETIRFYGVNTPESRTKDLKEKEKGLKVKAWVKERIEGKEVMLKSIKQGKFGRYLGTIYLGDLCINEELIRLKMAVPYFGGKR